MKRFRNKINKIWIKIKKWVIILYCIGLFLLFIALMIAGTGILFDSKMLQDAMMVNSIAIIIGLLSLPGIIVQLIGLVIKSTPQYKFEGTCPKCKSLVESKMTEVE